MSINLPSKVYSTYELQAPSLSHLQKSVDRAVKEGRVSRLTDRVLQLPRKKQTCVQIPGQRLQSKMKDLNEAVVLTEKNDGANDVYRNAATGATQIADIDRYSQGTFDLSLHVAGRNADSYFSGTMNSPCDIDYFHVDTSSQILSRRPVIVNMEMPEGADYDLVVYDDQGNQVGMAVSNGDGTKTLTIPCDWSSCRNFVIKISQHDSDNSVEGNYKLTFSQGDMPRETAEWMERLKEGTAVQTTPEERYEMGLAAKEKREAANAEGINRLHQKQYEELPEELKYKGAMSASELLEEEKNGKILSEAEGAYIAIYGNQNEIYQEEVLKRKQGLEQEFADFLESMGLSDKSFEIYLPPFGNAQISGLYGDEKKAVEDYVTAHRDSFQNVYLENSGETEAMTDYQYRIAGYVAECNRFLGKASDGKISVEDLSIKREQTGKIVNEEIAGLPYKVASLINGADSTSSFFDYQQMLYDILQYKEVYGEIPEYHVNFGWNGNELTGLKA